MGRRGVKLLCVEGQRRKEARGGRDGIVGRGGHWSERPDSVCCCVGGGRHGTGGKTTSDVCLWPPHDECLSSVRLTASLAVSRPLGAGCPCTADRIEHWTQQNWTQQNRCGGFVS